MKLALAHFTALLDQLPAGLERPVAQVALFTESLRQQALSPACSASGTPVMDVLTASIEMCARTPDRPAVRFDGVFLTYTLLSVPN